MIIDKSIGVWWTKENEEAWGEDFPKYPIDDIAYHFHCQSLKDKPDWITPQEAFLTERDSEFIKEFYDVARLIIRKEKIEKIQKRMK